MAEIADPPSRLRALLLLLVFGVCVSVALSVLLAPLALGWLRDLGLHQFAFRRVLRRVAELSAAAVLVAALFRLGVRRWAGVGLGAVPNRARDFWRALLAACAGTAAALVLEFVHGDRTISSGISTAEAAHILLASCVVGFVAQAICAGALLFPFELRGTRLAVAGVAVAALFASAHFLRGGNDPAVAGWAGGWQVWSGVVDAIGRYREAWTGLFVFGLAIYLLAARQGHAWGAIGAHVGAVLALQTAGALGDVPPGMHPPFSVDGLLPGYGAAALLAPWIFWRLASELRGGVGTED